MRWDADLLCCTEGNATSKNFEFLWELHKKLEVNLWNVLIISMILQKLLCKPSHSRLCQLAIKNFRRHGFCSSAVEFLNPDEIGNLSLKLDDSRISNLLRRYRTQFDDALAKKVSLKNVEMEFLQRLTAVEARIAEVDRQLDDLKKNFPDCHRPEQNSADPVLEIETTDSELAKMVEEDRQGLVSDRRNLENALLSDLAAWLLRSRSDGNKIPTDLILEVSAGVGGQEAMLFTKEIFDMYRRYAEYRQWKFDILEEQMTDLSKRLLVFCSCSCLYD